MILDKIIFYSLVVLLILTPLPYGTVEVWSTALWELLIVILVLLWSVEVLLNKQFEIVISPVVWPMLALAAIALIQILPLLSGPRKTFTHDSFATVDAGVKILVLIFFMMLFGSIVKTDQRRQQIVTTIIVMSTVIALIGIGQSYLGKVIWPRALNGYGPFVNRNHFAGFLEMGIGLAGARVLSRTIRRETLVLYICYLIIMITGLVLSASRGGFLALGGVIIFLTLTFIPMRADNRAELGRGMQLRFIGAVILLIVLAFGAMFLTSSDELMQRFTNVQQEVKTGELADERFSRRDLWETTGRIIKDYPFLGIGLGAYQYVYPRYDRSSGILRAEQSHNDYLQILVDAGILGGLTTIAFLILLFGRGFAGLQTRHLARRAVTAGALAGCFGIAVHSFVDFNLQVTNNAQLFLALAVLATTKPLDLTPKPEIENTSQEFHQHLLR